MALPTNVASGGTTSGHKTDHDLIHTEINALKGLISAPVAGGKVVESLATALAGTPGQSGFPEVDDYGQVALVQGTFASPVNAGAGNASPPQINIQRYIKPNDDGSGVGSPGVFIGSTRYGDGTSGNGDMHDYYNLFSVASSSATADIAPNGGHSVIGAAFYAKALTGSDKAKAFGAISYAVLASGSTHGRAIAHEFDSVNMVGTDAPDITSGAADGMTMGVNIAAFGPNKNSAPIVIQAGSSANQWLQGITFWPTSIATGGYLLNASGLVGANILRTSDVLIAVGSGSPESVVTAKPGSLYLSTGGSLYVKATGTGNTGWAVLS